MHKLNETVITNNRLNVSLPNGGNCTRLAAIDVTFGVAEGVIWLIICILTVGANTVSIFTLTRSKRRNTNHSVYLVSLLTSNLAYGTAIHPILAYSSFHEEVPCSVIVVIYPIVYLGVFVSILSAKAITIDRLLALKTTAPIGTLNQISRQPGRKNKKALRVVAAIWLIGILAAIGFWKKEIYAKIARRFVFFLFASTLVLLLIVYVRIKRLSRQSTNVSGISVTNRRHRASLKLVTLLICCMVITWLPMAVIKVLTSGGAQISITGISVAVKMFLLNPLLDPLCYVLVKHYC